MSSYRANDIRGIYGEELSDKDAYALGNAFARFTKSSRIIVGRDNRTSSPALHSALVKGILDSGVDVIDIGLVDSPAFYFATHYFNRAGIMITASHNPPEYNGFYVCGKNALPINETNGLKKIEQLAKKIKREKNKGQVYIASIWRHYVKHVLSFIDYKKIKPMSIVVDAGNGMGASITSRIASFIPQVHIHSLFFESDGRYPNRGPDPAKNENLIKLGKEVRVRKADFGIALDGDADRAALVDQYGEPIEGSLTGALLAKHLLKKHKKEKIVYSSTCSRILPETIRANGGIPIREKVGHTFIKLRMRKDNALFGIENTGHFMYRENSYADSGIITALLFCELLSHEKKSVSSLIQPLQKYYKSPEINFHTKSSNVINKISLEIKKMKPKSYDTYDGISADFKDYWVSIRASKTEPLIRLVIEGKDKNTVEKNIPKFEAVISKFI